MWTLLRNPAGFSRLSTASTLLNAAWRATSRSIARGFMRIKILLFAAAVVGMARLFDSAMLSAEQAPATAPAPTIIEVTARRFEFEPSKIEVTEGDHVRLVVKSEDGVHGFEIKKFRVNKLIPRGNKPVTIDFVANAPGTFPIMCSEECGDGHEDMKGTLVVIAKAK
jgi:cytochrome c oxidase subunit II